MNNFLVDIFFPIKCFNCGAKNEIFCSKCIAKTEKVEGEIDENILAIFDYKDPIIKKAIWELKYYHKSYLGEKLGNLLYEFLIEDISKIKKISLNETIYVIPIPISKNKKRSRGYNQSFIIANSFCNIAGKNIFKLKDNIIFKKIETIPQAKINNRQKRLKNIKGVFEIKKPYLVKDKIIIIIDDVITTGGTIKEVMKILKKAGAKKIFGFALAH